MWDEILAPQEPLVETVLRTVVIYLLVLGLVRVAGKRGLASMNSMDFVLLLVLAGAVQVALVGADSSVAAAGVSALTLVVLNSVINRLTASVTVAERFLVGRPTTIIEDGRPVESELRRLGIRTSELEHVVRSQQGDDVTEIAHGKLTPSGQFVLSLKAEEQGATKGDVAALEERLERIEQLLSARQ